MSDKIPSKWFSASSYSSPLGELWSAHRVEYLNPREGDRVVGAFILPPFQRPAVWTLEQKVRLIESIWSELPIGTYIVNDAYGTPYDSWLLDGQQRVTAIIEYIDDQFPVYGYKYSELDKVDHNHFEFGRTFPKLVTTITDETKLRDVYDRLAYGGTPHEPKAISEKDFWLADERRHKEAELHELNIATDEVERQLMEDLNKAYTED